MSTVTIIIATYNREHTLGRTIESVLAQDLADWELLVVDDGSQDASAALVQGYADGRIKLLRHVTNRGVTAAKNTGLDHISGDWFTTIDSDDEMVPDALSLMISTAGKTGATSVTCNGIDSVTGELTGTGIEADGRLDRSASAALRGVHWGITRTELLGDMRFDERLPWGEEALWTKVNHRARRYGVSRPLLIVHTEGADRLTVKNVKKRGLGAKLDDFRALGEDEEYLRILQETDPAGYARLRSRIIVARVLRPGNGARR